MKPALSPFPLAVPHRLIEAFRHLESNPVLVGGKAVQVWTGLNQGLFQTYDLDFITSLRAEDFPALGLDIEASGRHILVEGQPVEFPAGPLAVGDLQLNPASDAVEVPTLSGDIILCLRPEACVLDRLAQVAAWQVAEAYAQAAAIAAAQMDQPGWNSTWIEDASRKAGLSKQWTLLKGELACGEPSEAAMDEALRIGWD